MNKNNKLQVLMKSIKKYQSSSFKKTLWQIVTTFTIFFALWVTMYFFSKTTYQWWVNIPLAFLTGAVMIRIFIFFHDCGHGSFFKSSKANNIFGFICGIITFTPFHHWTWEHATHHSSSGNLARRGVGDINTMTIKEYSNASFWYRLYYRLVRHPLLLFTIIPLLLFVIIQRFPVKKAPLKERMSVHWTNLSLIIIFGTFPFLFGWQFLILIFIAGGFGASLGIWMFYIQHQFEETYWESDEKWQYIDAALKGSSFYKLPNILQWFTGNIGFHHVHHLNPRIPNYNLSSCHKNIKELQRATTITLAKSFHSMFLHIWDESSQKLITFKHAHMILKEQAHKKT